MIEEADLEKLGVEPISAECPCGRDMRGDREFEELQAEVERSSLPSLAGAVDWEKVVRIAAEILSSQSKDLQVAGYLAVGLVHTRRAEGLAAGLKMYRDLLRHHGERLFPERERGRLRSVEWWLEKSEPALKELEAAEADSATLTAVEEIVSELECLIADLLPEAPRLKILRDFCRRAVASRGDSSEAIPSPAPETVAIPPPAREPGAPGGSAKTPAVAIAAKGAQTSLPTEGRETLEEGLRRLREAAEMLRRRDPADEVAYRLSRQAAWLSVSDLPPSTKGRTLLSPPSPQVGKRLAELKKTSGTDYVAAVEAELAQHIFWLDLNRMAAEALTEMGKIQAGAVVKEETANLLRRLPGLDELCFADGTPFADGLTRKWLERGWSGEGVSGSEKYYPPMPAGAEPDRSMEEEVLEASSLLGQGKLIQAIELLQWNIRSCPSERERTRWRLALSRVLLKAGQTDLALPQLEQLLEEIERFRLEAYEPAVALEGLRLAWCAFDGHGDPKLKERAREILHRIARVDPTEMVRLIQGCGTETRQGGRS